MGGPLISLLLIAIFLFGIWWAFFRPPEQTNPFIDNTLVAPKHILIVPPTTWFNSSDTVYTPEAPKASSESDTSVMESFSTDCVAHKGTLYNAEEWNALSGDNLAPGQFHCNVEAHWSVDP